LTLISGRNLLDFDFFGSADATAEPSQVLVASTAGEQTPAAPGDEAVEDHGQSDTTAGAATNTASAEGHADSPETQGEGEQQEEHEGSHGGGHGGGHSDPIAPILFWLVVILASAKLGGDLFDRIGQPAVLGELIAGVVIGNVLFFLGHDFMAVLREGTTLFNVPGQLASGHFDIRSALQLAFPGDADSVNRFAAIHEAGHLMTYIDISRIIDIVSRLGVIILLFLVGLESNLVEMMRVGLISLLVAVVGVIAPFILGYFASYMLMPAESIYVHLFVGATLCATSVGITARVFKDLNKLQTQEAKIILGAAVIDDVLGLIILAITQGIIVAADSPDAAGGGSMGLSIIKIIFLSIAFLGGAILVGVKFNPWMTRQVSKMRVPGMKLIYSLAFAFILSWLANFIGLATIVGAFAAGLVLDDVYFKDFTGEHHHLEELIEPIATVFVPVFFVLMGLQVKLETFAQPSVLGIALGITVAAVVGKQVCGLVIRNPAVSKLSVGVGMIPRGEVGLIFAAIGKTLTYHGEPVVNSGTFSAVVIMVIVTTLMTPPVLKVTMRGVKTTSSS